MNDYLPEVFEIRGAPDREVVEEVVKRKVYLKDFILPFIKPNGLIIDIGAHIGSFAIQSSLLQPKAVLAIEPDQSSLDYLIRNVSKAKLGHIIHPIQMALYD